MGPSSLPRFDAVAIACCCLCNRSSPGWQPIGSPMISQCATMVIHSRCWTHKQRTYDDRGRLRVAGLR
eukprot:1935221-Alexandrium_andersonii.AAC.1